MNKLILQEMSLDFLLKRNKNSIAKLQLKILIKNISVVRQKLSHDNLAGKV